MGSFLLTDKAVPQVAQAETGALEGPPEVAGRPQARRRVQESPALREMHAAPRGRQRRRNLRALPRSKAGACCNAERGSVLASSGAVPRSSGACSALLR